MNGLEDFAKEFKKLEKKVAAVVRERDRLRRQLQSQPVAKTESSPAADVLRKALAMHSGWREEARIVLGEYKLLNCEFCGNLFPSGGHRRKSCGECPGQ